MSFKELFETTRLAKNLGMTTFAQLQKFKEDNCITSNTELITALKNKTN